MAKLKWDQPGEKEFEIGVDRGVLFPDSLFGYAWSGLQNVTEKPSGGEARSYYIDGQKFITSPSVTEFAATIEALSAPNEFDFADGIEPLSVGLSKTHQKRQKFAFAYRTKIGNDLEGPNAAYKIHIVYNAIAHPSDRQYQSIGDNNEPLKLSWEIETVSQILQGSNPTSHLVFDSRVIPAYLMEQIEDLLYGYEYGNSTLIPQDTLIAAINSLPFAHQNLYLNPSFEKASDQTTVVQTNYHNNPQAANIAASGYSTGYGGWAGTGNTNHFGYGVASDWSKSGLVARVKWDTVTASSGDISVYFGYSATQSSLTAGQKVTLVFSYSTPKDGIIFAPPKLYGAANAQFAWTARSREGNVVSEAGVVYTDWCTFVLPATWDDNSRMTVQIAGDLAVNDYIEESMGNLYLGDYDPDKEWFSGSISYDNALVPSWVGDGNNSASILTGAFVARVTQTGKSKAVQSSEWNAGRSYSVKVVPEGSGTDTFAAPLELTFNPGQPYTVLATCHLTHPQVNQINDRPRRIVFFYKASGSSAYTEIYSDQAPNEAGTTEIRFMFTPPAGSSGYILRLYNGSDNGSVWWDDLLVIPEVYGGDYFDGDTESPDRWTTYEWDNSAGPDNSTSTKRDWVPPM